MLELLEMITALSDEQAMEAAGLLSGTVLGSTPDEDVRSNAAKAIGIDPAELQHAINRARPNHVASFARVVLIIHATYKSPTDVEEVIAHTGEKAFLLEVAIVGLLVLGILHAIQTKGKSGETQTTRIEISPDGKVTVTIERKVTYFNVGETLGSLAGALLESLQPPAG
jgi:hypothetical protein